MKNRDTSQLVQLVQNHLKTWGLSLMWRSLLAGLLLGRWLSLSVLIIPIRLLGVLGVALYLAIALVQRWPGLSHRPWQDGLLFAVDSVFALMVCRLWLITLPGITVMLCSVIPLEWLTYQSDVRMRGSVMLYLLAAILISSWGFHASPLLAWHILLELLIGSLFFYYIFQITQQILIKTRGPSSSVILTPREQEIYALMQQGLSTAQIATQLHIEIGTVKTHRHHIRHKLHRSSR